MVAISHRGLAHGAFWASSFKPSTFARLFHLRNMQSLLKSDPIDTLSMAQSYSRIDYIIIPIDTLSTAIGSDQYLV